MIRSCVVIALSCFLLALFAEQIVGESSQSPRSPSVNEYCPVMPDSLATGEWNTVYRGQQINFCCNNCVDSFRANPQGYLDRLPHVPHLADDEPSLWMTARTQLISGMDWSRSPQGRPVFVFVAGGLFWFTWRTLQRRRQRNNVGALTVRPVFAEVLVFGLLAAVIQLLWNNSHLEEEIVKQRVLRVVHHSTYHDHGYYVGAWIRLLEAAR